MERKMKMLRLIPVLIVALMFTLFTGTSPAKAGSPAAATAPDMAMAMTACAQNVALHKARGMVPNADDGTCSVVPVGEWLSRVNVPCGSSEIKLGDAMAMVFPANAADRKKSCDLYATASGTNDGGTPADFPLPAARRAK